MTLTLTVFLSADRRCDVVILSTVTSELNMHVVKAIHSGDTIRKQGLETLGDPNRLCAAISISRQGLLYFVSFRWFLLSFCAVSFMFSVSCIYHEDAHIYMHLHVD